MFDFVIGAGQGGSRVGLEFAVNFNIGSVFMNLAGVDFSKFNAPRNTVLLLESGGTGKDPIFGESVVRNNLDQVKSFLINQRGFARAKYILLCVGGGGGSGCGFMFPVLDYLLRCKKEVLLIYTLPENREGLPAKPNSLVVLNRVIEHYLQKDVKRKISILLIDNDFCVHKYGNALKSYDYWRSVNRGIMQALKRFWMMTNLENYKNYVDAVSGYSSLDKHDVLRVLFSNNGYTDIRELSIDVMNLNGFGKQIKTSSLVFGSLDARTAKKYIISIGVPDSWKEKRGILSFIENVFGIVGQATKNAPDVVRCSYFNKKLQRVHVHLLLSGLSKSHGLEKLINSTRKDVIQLQSRGDVEKLDLTGINY